MWVVGGKEVDPGSDYHGNLSLTSVVTKRRGCDAKGDPRFAFCVTLALKGTHPHTGVVAAREALARLFSLLRKSFLLPVEYPRQLARLHFLISCILAWPRTSPAICPSCFRSSPACLLWLVSLPDLLGSHVLLKPFLPAFTRRLLAYLSFRSSTAPCLPACLANRVLF